MRTPVRIEKMHSIGSVSYTHLDVYKRQVPNHEDFYREHGCVCVEMESFALFHNARILGKHAACLLTISDSLVSKSATSAQERQTSFHKMMVLALESACALEEEDTRA